MDESMNGSNSDMDIIEPTPPTPEPILEPPPRATRRRHEFELGVPEQEEEQEQEQGQEQGELSPINKEESDDEEEIQDYAKKLNDGEITQDELVEIINNNEFNNITASFEGIKLVEKKIENADVTDVSFDNSELIDCQIEGLYTENTSFRNCNLYKSKFERIIFGNTDFSESNMEECILRDFVPLEEFSKERTLILNETDLSKAELIEFEIIDPYLMECKNTIFDEVTIKGSKIHNVSFQECSMIKLKLENFTNESEREVRTTFHNNEFNNCNIQSLALGKVLLYRCSFNKSNLDNGIIEEAELLGCRFLECVLKNMQADLSNFENSIFNKCNLKELKIENACSFKNAKIIRSILEGSVIKNTNFKNCDFTNSNLSNCTFENCDFTLAIFQNTNMNNSSVIGCTFKNNNMLQVKVDGVDFSKAKTVENILLVPYDESLIVNQVEQDVFREREDEEDEEERVAYQVHDIFKKIRPTMPKIQSLLESINGKSEGHYKSIPNIADYIEDYLKDYIRSGFFNGLSEKKKEELEKEGKNEYEIKQIEQEEKAKLQDLLEEFMTKFSNTSISKEDETKILLGNVIDFVMKQNEYFIDLYIKTFIKDCSEAYDEEVGQSSCVQGIIERMIMILLDNAGLIPCKEESQEVCNELAEIVKTKFTQEDVNEITEKWTEEVDQEKPEGKLKYGSILNNETLPREEIFKNDYIIFGCYLLKEKGLLLEENKKMIRDEAEKLVPTGIFTSLQIGGKKNRKLYNKFSKSIKNEIKKKKEKSKKNKKVNKKSKKNKKTINKRIKKNRVSRKKKMNK